MSTTPTIIQSTNFSAVPNTPAGDPPTNVIILTPTLVAPNLTGVNAVSDAIRQAIADDVKITASTGNTALPPPDNITFFDYTVSVGGSITGDKFVGATPGITSQFVDLTPDNLMIRAVTPNAFLRSDTGNDVLLATGGSNILSAGSGTNVMVAGAGSDTMLADATKANASETVLNFGSGDNAVLLGIDPSKLTLSVADTANGLVIAAAAQGNTPTVVGDITLAGYTAADIGTKLTLGASTTTDGKQFIFFHGN